MIGILDASQRLSSEAVRYWKKLILSNLKVGVEIEFELSSGDNSDLQSTLKRKFNPSGSFVFSNNGIYEITGDGSLRNGLELKTSGRRLDFMNLYIQYKTYYDAFPPEVHITERCGLHNHVLLDYGSSYTSMETPMPGVIFKNFAQLIRRHAPELVWITSTMKHNRSFTRYEGFCKADTLYKYTPANRNITEYMSRIRSEGQSRYKFLNILNMKTVDDHIKQLHFELRYPDGSIYPAQIAAQNILHGALLIKAVELSELGVIDTGDESEWTITKNLYSQIRQGDGYSSNRFSEPPTQSNLDLIKQRALDMLKFLKSSISQYDVRAYTVLKFLAMEPISIMRRTKTDDEIVNDFHSLVKSMCELDTEKFDSIIESINLLSNTGAVTTKQWCYQVSAKIGKTIDQVQNDIDALSKIKPLEFDMELGSYVFK